MARCIVIMGVSGCGKTTVGKMLAKTLSFPFYDADDFHPKENKEKMMQGIPLDDADRRPWLMQLSNELHRWQQEKGAVLACSALKETYRQQLLKKTELSWVYLSGNFETIQMRMQKRTHFMPPELLLSQFEVLEIPNYGIHCDILEEPETIVATILKELNA